MKENKSPQSGPSDTKKIVHQGKYLRFINDATWEYVERTNCNGAVIILAVNADNKVIFIEQYRKPMKQHIIELPAGLVNDHGGEESMETAAIRELEEETGYTASHTSYLTGGPTAPGLTNELISIVQAHNLSKIGDGGGDSSEDIIVHEVPLSEVDDWLNQMSQKGYIIDVKVFSGLYFLKKWPKKMSS